MARLTEQEQQEVMRFLEADKPLPEKYRFLLFDDKREVELVWNGKTNEVSNVVLPFQTIEHVDEPRAETTADRVSESQGFLFSMDERGRQLKGWTNKLIWGDNKLILSSLKNGPLRDEIEKQGGLKLIYIDPPFDVGADFSMDIEVGDGGDTFTKRPNILEEIAYRDTWGKGADSFISMIYERLILMRDLLAEDGSIYVHMGPRQLVIRLAWMMDESGSEMRTKYDIDKRGTDVDWDRNMNKRLKEGLETGAFMRQSQVSPHFIESLNKDFVGILESLPVVGTAVEIGELATGQKLSFTAEGERPLSTGEKLWIGTFTVGGPIVVLGVTKVGGKIFSSVVGVANSIDEAVEIAEDFSNSVRRNADLVDEAPNTGGRGLIGLVKPGGTVDDALRAHYVAIAQSPQMAAAVGRYNKIARFLGEKPSASIDDIVKALGDDVTFSKVGHIRSGVFEAGQHPGATRFWLQGNPTTAYGQRVGRHELTHIGAALKGQGDTFLHEIAVQAATTPENLVFGVGSIVVIGGTVYWVSGQ